MRLNPTSPNIRRHAWRYAVAALVSTAALGSGQAQAQQTTGISANSGDIETMGSQGGQYNDVFGSNAPTGTGSAAQHFAVIDFSASAFGFATPNVSGVQGGTLTLTLIESPFTGTVAGSSVEAYLTTNNTVSLATTTNPVGSTSPLTYQTSTDTSTTNAPYGIDPQLGVLPGSSSSGTNSNVLYDLGGGTFTNTANAKDTFTFTLSAAAQAAFIKELGTAGGGDARLVLAASSPTSGVGYDGSSPTQNSAANRPALTFTPVYNTANNLYWQGGASTWSNAGGTMWNTSNAAPGTTGWNNDGAHIGVFAETTGSTVMVGPGISANGIEFDTTGYTLTPATAGNTLTLSGSTPYLLVSTAGSTATVNVPLAGTAGMTKFGAGTLILGSSNTYTGGTTVSLGTLQISADNNLGAASTTAAPNNVTLNGGTLATTASIASARAIAGTGTIQIGAGNTLSSTGVVNLTSLTLSGGGTFALLNNALSLSGGGASNAVSGTVTFTTAGATLTASSTGAGPSDGQGIINLGGISATQTSGTVTLAANSNLAGTVTVSVPTSGATLNVSGGLGGAAVVAKTGSGTLVLNGENSTLSGSGTTPASIRQGSAGATPTSGGIISIGAANPDPANALGTGMVQGNGGTISNDTGAPVTLAISGISLGAQNAATTPGGLVFTGSGANPAITVGGTISLFRGGSVAYQQAITANVPTTFTGLLSLDTAANTSTGVMFMGTSTITLAGTKPNTLTEPVTIATSGTGSGVFLSAVGAFGANAQVTINAAATLTISTGAVSSGVANAINDNALLAFASPAGTFGKLALNQGQGVIETVGGLYLAAADGTLAQGYQPAGTYGPAGSGATHIDNTLFSGMGEINNLGTAVMVPEPSTWAALLIGLGGLGLVSRRRRA